MDYDVTSSPLEGRPIKTPDDKILNTLEGIIIEESKVKQILQQNDSLESDERTFNEFRDKIISPLQKNCTDNIESSILFNNLENLKIKEVYILGVDMSYFEEIRDIVNSAKWNISY